MKNKIINLKCIDDYNNYLSLILESNINGLLKILNLDYKIEIPESNFFPDEDIVFNTEDTENEEIKKIEEKEDAVRKAKEHEINEETEEFIEKSKKNKGSIMYIYDGKAGPMVSIQNDENAIDNWFMSISEYLKSV